MTDSAADVLAREAADANTNRDEPAKKAGRAVAELVDVHSWSFDEVVARTGIPRGTAHRWSAPYRTKKAEGESA